MTSSRYTLGIDPTALALYDAQEPARSCIWDMPIDARGIQVPKLGGILEEVIMETCGSDFRCDVRAIIRDGWDAGVICGELASFAIPYTFGRTTGQGTTQQARQMFPNMAHLFDKEGRARALMTAVRRNQP